MNRGESDAVYVVVGIAVCGLVALVIFCVMKFFWIIAIVVGIWLVLGLVIRIVEGEFRYVSVNTRSSDDLAQELKAAADSVDECGRILRAHLKFRENPLQRGSEFLRNRRQLIQQLQRAAAHNRNLQRISEPNAATIHCRHEIETTLPICEKCHSRNKVALANGRRPTCGILVLVLRRRTTTNGPRFRVDHERGAIVR